MNPTFLFADPSFWTGVARLLDLDGRFDDYNFCQTGKGADTLALFADWAAVGDCLSEAVSAFDEEVRGEQSI